MRRNKAEYIYESDCDVEPYQVGEVPLVAWEAYCVQVHWDDCRDKESHCRFCFRYVWNCKKIECKNRYKAMLEFEKRQKKIWKGAPRKKKRRKKVKHL